MDITPITLFLAQIGFSLPETFKQVDHLLADQLRLWQYKNQVTILKKAEKYCKQKNKPIKEIPKTFLAPLLEEAKNQDDETLQNMWANLLANAATGEALHPSYIKIINELTSVEANLLMLFYQKYIHNKEREMDKEMYFSLIEEKVKEISTLSISEIQSKKSVIINNLMRLSLIDLIADNQKKHKAQISNYAIDFIKSCIYE